MGRRRRAEATAPAVQQVPAMEPCAGCGLLLEAGTDPSGRAWHDCDRVRAMAQPATLEGIEQLALQRMRETLQLASAKDALAIYRQLQEAKKPAEPAEPKGKRGEKKDKPSGKLLKWASGPE